MKNKMFFGAALLALASAGTANAGTGYVGLSYQNTDVGGGSDLESTGLSGAVLFGEHFQANARYSSIEFGPADADAWAIDGFLFNRGEGGAFGGYVGAGSIDFDGGGSSDSWAAGLVAQKFTARTNWTGQLGYTDTDGDVTILHLDGEARHFVGDNFSIQANLGYGNMETPGDDDDFWTGGIGAEFQFSGAPVSIYGGWQRIESDGDIDALGIGVRYNWSGSLFDRSRSGAGMSRAAPTFFELLTGGSAGPR